MGKCKYCGCTDGHACAGGCVWIEENVCSSCIIKSKGASAFCKAYKADPEVERIEVFVTRKGQKKKEGFLVIQ